MHFKLTIATLFLSVFLVGCVTPPEPLSTRNSELTQGNVQMNLRVGETTKADVLETFGAPNVTTRDGRGLEVWTYQRQAQVAQSSSQSGYWTILFAGSSSRSSGFESTSRMMTLILRFNDRDVLEDFNSRTSNF